MDQFIDLCILLGCDYCDSIRGIGPVRAFDLISKYGSLESVLQNLGPKFAVPARFDFVQVRQLFKAPEVLPPDQIPPLKWQDPDVPGLLQFLVKEKGFSEDRIQKAIATLKKCKSSAVQERLTTYFGEPKKRKLTKDLVETGKRPKASVPASAAKNAT